MKLFKDTLTITGSPLLGDTPQPRFRDLANDGDLHCDHTFSGADRVDFNCSTGQRILPYRMQERYHRGNETLCYDTIVLENEHLRAEFLPQWGARLRSLWDKDAQREVLYVNPVNRPSNIANRGAWVSGGIEWNLGHTGHFAFTSDPVYCARVQTPTETFLRIYEYEATHCQMLQIDFHLPQGAKQLAAHVTLTNMRDSPRRMYWWTNVAVPLTNDTRVISSTSDIMYQLYPNVDTGRPGFGRAQMPEQPNLPGIDVSYPLRIPFSVEYFFQNPTTMAAPWEVSVEADGKGFYERSTQPLCTRKMFSWGNSKGGQHWCDYLAEPGKGDYVELQAGLAPTQNHILNVPEQAVISFTQLFGGFDIAPDAVGGTWAHAMPNTGVRVEELLSTKDVLSADARYKAMATLPATEMLCQGKNYGALEAARREKAGEVVRCAHLEFTGYEQSPWTALLQGAQLPQTTMPLAYLTDPLWIPYLESAAGKPDVTPATRYHLGVSLIENGRIVQGESVLKLVAQEGDAWANFALGASAKRNGNMELACDYFQKAYDLADGVDQSFGEALVDALVALERHTHAWELFQSIPKDKQTELMWITVAISANALRHDAFLADAFQREYATIREGAVGLADLWISYMSRKECEEKNIPFTPDQIDFSRPLPTHMNFRMFENRGK